MSSQPSAAQPAPSPIRKCGEGSGTASPRSDAELSGPAGSGSSGSWLKPRERTPPSTRRSTPGEGERTPDFSTLTPKTAADKRRKWKAALAAKLRRQRIKRDKAQKAGHARKDSPADVKKKRSGDSKNTGQEPKKAARITVPEVEGSEYARLFGVVMQDSVEARERLDRMCTGLSRPQVIIAM